MRERELTWEGDENKERRRLYIREYQRKRKAQFKAKGICPNCEHEPSGPGKVCCQRCLDDKKLTVKFGTAGPYRQLYSEMFVRQKGLCGICQNPMTRPLLDHNHETMAVRGLLCSSCNVGLGQFKDDPELLARALRYVSDNIGIGISLKRRG